MPVATWTLYAGFVFVVIIHLWMLTKAIKNPAVRRDQYCQAVGLLLRFSFKLDACSFHKDDLKRAFSGSDQVFLTVPDFGFWFFKGFGSVFLDIGPDIYRDWFSVVLEKLI